MRILVSGATGVIGRRAVPLLLKQGHDVTALTRHPTEPTELVGTRWVMADLFDRNALRKTAAGHDVLINLATHMPSAAWKMLFRSAWRLNDRIRTQGVANLVDAALDAGIATIIQESFAPAYPDCGDHWIEEDTAPEPTAYNRTILDAEASIARFSAADRTGVTLRFATFYGPDAMQVHSYIDGLRRGWAAIPGRPDAFISSISHDDAATAVVAALRAPAGAYNVGDDEPVTREIYFGSLAENLGLQSPRFLPAWTTPLFGSAGRLIARSVRISNRKLKEKTSWAPALRSVREGWPAMLKQMKIRAP